MRSISKWEFKMSLEDFDIEFLLVDTSSSSIKQLSQQESRTLISITAMEASSENAREASSESAMESSSESVMISSVLLTESPKIPTSVILNTMATPTLHSDNILNFVSLVKIVKN